MPTFVTLVNFTEAGLVDFENLADRLEAAEGGIKAAGGKFISWHLTMGRYDAVVITEFPDAEAAAKWVLTIARQGNIRTETLQAFSRKEAEKMASEFG